jgi:uncharacterized iron-regulated protein
MARTIGQAVLPGKTVVLLAGSGHVNRVLGVPQHLPPGTKVKAVHLRAGPAAIAPDARQEAESKAAFDAVWPTPAVPEQDHCKDLQEKFRTR